MVFEKIYQFFLFEYCWWSIELTQTLNKVTFIHISVCLFKSWQNKMRLMVGDLCPHWSSQQMEDDEPQNWSILGSRSCLSLRVENRTSVLHVSMTFMGLRGWGGVGWANNVHLHYLTYMMLRYCKSSCTTSHTWCYATVRLLALPHIHDATLL